MFNEKNTYGTKYYRKEFKGPLILSVHLSIFGHSKTTIIHSCKYFDSSKIHYKDGVEKNEAAPQICHK